ncbi:hypothetical protein ACFE04_004762 [Oxalis oulophora]
MTDRFPVIRDPDFKDFDSEPETYTETDHGFALSGKIMLSAIVVLFFVVLLMVCLHLYARWYLTRARRRQASIRRNRRAANHRMIFYVDADNTSVTATRGLDASVLNSLPVFTYSEKTRTKSLDCAVCLSEFEENESGRVLPKCNHSFHVECIDMWFHSHSTCPLCRAPVERLAFEQENRDEVVLPVNELNAELSELGSGSGSGTCATCRNEEEQVGTSVDLDRRSKPTHVDIPRRNMEDLENELTRGHSPSPASQSFRSPMSRMLSFTRMLSRDRWTSTSEVPDIECGNTSKEPSHSDSVATQ